MAERNGFVPHGSVLARTRARMLCIIQHDVLPIFRTSHAHDADSGPASDSTQLVDNELGDGVVILSADAGNAAWRVVRGGTHCSAGIIGWKCSVESGERGHALFTRHHWLKTQLAEW
jgi:hypothetical protein